MAYEWQRGDFIVVELPDGRHIRCRIVNILDDGTVQVVPDDAAITL